MEEKIINIDRAISIAKNFNEENIKWHYHIITPNCSFREISSKYAVFIESENGNYLTRIKDISKFILKLRSLEELLFEQFQK